MFDWFKKEVEKTGLKRSRLFEQMKQCYESAKKRGTK
jgi:hypothetical protein